MAGEIPVEGEIDFERLGRRFRLSGGFIKNAVFKAAFRAARAGGAVSQEILEEAAREEMGTAGIEGEGGIGFACRGG
jgi:hypothetical protein